MVFGAFLDGALAGVVGLAREAREKNRHKASVFGMYVAAEFGRRGIGRALLRHVIAVAKREVGLEQLVLTVTQTNAPRARSTKAKASARSASSRARSASAIATTTRTTWCCSPARLKPEATPQSERTTANCSVCTQPMPIIADAAAFCQPTSARSSTKSVRSSITVDPIDEQLVVPAMCTI